MDSSEKYDLNPVSVQPSWPEALPAHKSNDQIWPENRNPYRDFDYEP